MAVKLVKSVSRETLSVTGHKKRKVIVTLEGGDLISFRAKGTRKSYEIYLGHCFVLAQILQANSDYKKKMELYTIKKKAGMRVKKPKKLFLPFSKMYFDAIEKSK